MTISGPIICDASGLIALADLSDPDHAGVADCVADASGPFVLSPLVVAETDRLLRHRCGDDAARIFANGIVEGAYDLAALSLADLAACLDLDRRYAGLCFGLADAHLIVLAQTYRTESLLTLDERHMRAVRPVHGPRSFSLLPADA